MAPVYAPGDGLCPLHLRPTSDTLHESASITVGDVEDLSAELDLDPKALTCEDLCDAYVVSAVEADHNNVTIESCELELDLSAFVQRRRRGAAGRRDRSRRLRAGHLPARLGELRRLRLIPQPARRRAVNGSAGDAPGARV